MYDSEKSLISTIKSYHTPVTMTVKIEYISYSLHAAKMTDRCMTVKSLLFQ